MTAIEIFNNQGVIPPVADIDGASANRSPYEISIVEFVKLFAYTDERIDILEGLLKYRQELYKLEITGYQWLDGSFVENVEELRNRPPADIDIMTFFATSDTNLEDEDWDRRLSLLVDRDYTKPNFYVDGFVFPLNIAVSPASVKSIAYWLSLFSHQRETNTYKGFFVVSLDQNSDELAAKFLDSLQPERIENDSK